MTEIDYKQIALDFLAYADERTLWRHVDSENEGPHTLEFHLEEFLYDEWNDDYEGVDRGVEGNGGNIQEVAVEVGRLIVLKPGSFALVGE